jgi:aryl-alcohol dehydrogenase-like predicted oxidoreductase
VEYRFFGTTGLKVSELCLGTQTFGWVTDEEAAYEVLDLFIEHGGNFVDTANSYNQGLSESILGSWLKKRGNRRSLVLSSKVFFPVGPDPNESGLSRGHIVQALEDSLKRLGTDYLDLYQAHCYDYTTRIEETLSAFHDLVTAGKVRYIGVSNWSASQLVRAILLCGRQPGFSIDSLQAEYSLLVRSTEWELLPLCREEGLGFLAWSPLAGGWLSGKYQKGQAAPENSRVGRKDRWDDQPEQRASETTWKVLEALGQIGRERGKTSAQVALNWLLRQWEGITAILGARTTEQLKENLGAAGWKLSGDELQHLDAASSEPLPYLYRFLKRYGRRKGTA